MCPLRGQNKGNLHISVGLNLEASPLEFPLFQRKFLVLFLGYVSSIARLLH
jgi:hypothetical protein